MKDVTFGKATIRRRPDGQGGWSGLAIVGGKRVGDVLHDGDVDRLLSRLKTLAGTEHTSYFGMDGAIKRFCHFMEGGFAGERYAGAKGERSDKDRTIKAVSDALPLERARDAVADDASHLLFALRACRPWEGVDRMHEMIPLQNTLASRTGSAFIRSAARFADGEFSAGMSGMDAAAWPHGRVTWPMLTYLPVLWSPKEHMLLKPQVTREFAQRVGHPFASDYSSEHDPAVYRSLLDLTATTKAAIKALEPADNLDVQGFIWVVGRYEEADRSIPC